MKPMTPYEMVLSNFKLPFNLYKYQVETVNALAPLPRSGHYLAVGVGKTATSTVCALYKKEVGEIDQVIVLMPPILLTSWYRWLKSIDGVTALIYRGTVKQRKKMDLKTPQFILMSYQIFKGDFERINAELPADRTALICDEATAIKNIESATYKHVRDYGEHLMLLTGTPLAKVVDGYAYVKLLAPSVYRNYNQFVGIHVTRHDFFDRPVEFANLDILAKNMRVNAVRILKEDVLTQLPAIRYQPLYYDLDPKHLQLYHQLAEEQILELESGGKIDMTSASALWHGLQQIVMNYGYFADDPELRAEGYTLIDQTMDELDEREEGVGGETVPGKLIIFTNYRLTSAGVLDYVKTKYGGVAVYGAISAKQQQDNIDRFMTDPDCRVLVAQVQSAGYGLNLQDCCADVLFLEAPLNPIHFEQAVGRVYRNGQKKKVHIRVAVATGTIQVHLHKLLLAKDELVNKVVRNFQDLRKALYGE